MSLQIYVASKAWPAEIALWTALRGAGLPIIASWIDSEINRTDDDETSPDAWGRHWQTCLEQSAAADITIFYAPEGATQCGSALASGREVWLVSSYWWSVSHHPRCRVFPSIEACVAAVVARMKGERAAAEALAQLHRKGRAA
jgi:hypothetical protein